MKRLLQPDQMTDEDDKHRYPFLLSSEVHHLLMCKQALESMSFTQQLLRDLHADIIIRLALMHDGCCPTPGSLVRMQCISWIKNNPIKKMDRDSYKDAHVRLYVDPGSGRGRNQFLIMGLIEGEHFYTLYPVISRDYHGTRTICVRIKHCIDKAVYIGCKSIAICLDVNLGFLATEIKSQLVVPGIAITYDDECMKGLRHRRDDDIIVKMLRVLTQQRLLIVDGFIHESFLLQLRDARRKMTTNSEGTSTVKFFQLGEMVMGLLVLLTRATPFKQMRLGNGPRKDQ
jgi:hypothetical protein